MGRSSSFCAIRRWMRATTSTIPTPAYPGRIPPFRRNEFGFTNGGPVYIPHVYDGRKRTFYFTQYQGFRQVLGTTQVMPVPTAISDRSRAAMSSIDLVTYPDRAIDTLHVPVDPRIAAILARYPLPNLRPAPSACTHLCDGFEGRHQRRPILDPHRSQASRPRISSLRDSTATT